MSQPAVLCSCPHCHESVQQAVIPTPVAAFVSEVDKPAGQFDLKLLCTACGKTWSSISADAARFNDLVDAHDQLEDARRQIAALRLLVAKDRQRSIASPPATTRLKVFRAA